MSKLKIAVILVAYQSEFLPSVLAPWVRLKQGIYDDFGQRVEEPPIDIDVKICAVSALFKEYAELGQKYENENDSSTLNAYKQSSSIDEYIEIKDRVILDYQSRDIAWDYLKSWNPDLVWQVDSDEIYEYKDIVKAVSYIKNNNLYDYYRVRFKNFFGERSGKTFVDNFNPPRIAWNSKNGGIKCYYWDNELRWWSGSQTPGAANLTIPKTILFPSHHSWDYQKDPSKIIRKINYQHKALGHCSYKFENGKLVFDKGYYSKLGLAMPRIYEDT